MTLISDNPLSFHLDQNSGTPLYLQFKEQLLVHIRSRRLPPGARLPDIKTLAKLAGTSLKTVNTGLNELLRERVCIRSPKRGTFVAEEKSVLPPARRRRICLLYHKNPKALLVYDEVRQALLQGIQQGCQNHGIDLIFLTGSPIANIDFYNTQEQFEIVGVLFLEGLGSSEQMNIAEVFPNLRFVYFNDICDAFENSARNVYGIFHDDFSGGYGAGECLASRHPHTFACISVNLDTETYSRRRDGFRLALEENGYNLETALIDYASNTTTNRPRNTTELRQYGETAIREILAENPAIDAVFVVNDLIAEGVCNVLREKGLLDSVMLFGYDNIMPEISRSNHFSTVDVNFSRMGLRGIELIAASNYIPKAVFLPPHFICRLPLKQLMEQDYEQN